MNNRVVITGQGVVSPIGLNVKEYYLGLKAGKNGISNITHFDTSKHNVKIAGEVNIDINNYFNSKELNKIDRFTAFAIIVARVAESFFFILVVEPRSTQPAK